MLQNYWYLISFVIFSSLDAASSIRDLRIPLAKSMGYGSLRLTYATSSRKYRPRQSTFSDQDLPPQQQYYMMLRRTSRSAPRKPTRTSGASSRTLPRRSTNASMPQAGSGNLTGNEDFLMFVVSLSLSSSYASRSSKSRVGRSDMIIFRPQNSGVLFLICTTLQTSYTWARP